MRARSGRAEGFSVVELLVVIGLIGVMVAVSLPAIGRYIRNYRIRGAAQQVAGEVQTARLKAIMKNVNLGVAFVVLSSTTYKYVIEDKQTPPTSVVTRIPLDTTDPAQTGGIKTLPEAVEFGSTCTGFTGNDRGFRFDRLGAWCNPGSSQPCAGPDFTVGVANSVMNADPLTLGVAPTLAATICLVESRAGLTSSVVVSPGGRVRIP